jgi:hypothetical protein
MRQTTIRPHLWPAQRRVIGSWTLSTSHRRLRPGNGRSGQTTGRLAVFPGRRAPCAQSSPARPRSSNCGQRTISREVPVRGDGSVTGLSQPAGAGHVGRPARPGEPAADGTAGAGSATSTGSAAQLAAVTGPPAASVPAPAAAATASPGAGAGRAARPRRYWRYPAAAPEPLTSFLRSTRSPGETAGDSVVRDLSGVKDASARRRGLRGGGRRSRRPPSSRPVVGQGLAGQRWLRIVPLDYSP